MYMSVLLTAMVYTCPLVPRGPKPATQFSSPGIFVATADALAEVACLEANVPGRIASSKNIITKQMTGRQVVVM
jgi:hypothetical protein